MAKKNLSGIKEIARLSGVSIATVSRALNGNKTVDPILASKVLQVAKSLGYQPSPAARYMRSKKSGLLGIVVPKLTMSYFSDIVNGAIDKADEYGQLMIVGTVEGDSSTEQQFLNKLSHYMIDGLIYCPVAAGPHLAKLEILKHLPLVIAGRRKVLKGISHVSTNDEKAGYIATRYLLNLGRTNIGFFGGFWENPPFSNYKEMINSLDSEFSGSFSTMDRLHGYRRALEEMDIELDENKIIISGFDSESGYTSSRELFSRLDALDAVIVPNCLVARGVLKFFFEQRISIPDDISLISMDDLNIGELLKTPTTSIIHDMYNVGVEAVVQMNNILNQNSTEDSIIDVKLHIRQSTSQKKQLTQIKRLLKNLLLSSFL